MWLIDRLPLARGANIVPRRGTLSTRWALLIMAIASLVSLGSVPPDYGNGVGVLDDGTLVIDQHWSRYVSADGGLTWQPMYMDVNGHWRRVENVPENWLDTIQ